MAVKEPVPIKDSHRIINGGPLALISAAHNDASTITPIAWTMPVSSSPKLMGAAFAHKRFSLELIKESGEFCINIADDSTIEQIMFCGTKSGREVDKFKESGFTGAKCNKIGSLYIQECIAHIECTVNTTVVAGDHTIVIGEVVDAYCNESFLTEKGVVNLEKYRPLHHLGGDTFVTLKSL